MHFTCNLLMHPFFQVLESNFLIRPFSARSIASTRQCTQKSWATGLEMQRNLKTDGKPGDAEWPAER